MHENEKAASAGTLGGPETNSAGGEISPQVRAGIARVQDAVALYRGETLIVLRSGFDAITTRGERLGRYNTQAAAVAALLTKICGAP